MKEDINFITPAKKQQKQYASLFLMVSGSFFGVVFVIALALVVYSFILKSQATAIDKRVAALRTNIGSFGEQKNMLAFTTQRLSTIRQIIATRNKLDERITAIMDKVPQNLSVDGLTADKDIITIRLSSTNLSNFDDFLEVQLPLITKDTKLGIKRVDISSFSQRGNEYLLTIDFYFTIKKT